MIDRFLVWLGAIVVAAGLSAAMVAGAGLALADEGSTSGTGGGASSDSSNSTGNKLDSPKDTPGGGQLSTGGANSTKPDTTNETSGAESPSTGTGQDATERDATPGSQSADPDEGTGGEAAESSTTEVKPKRETTKKRGLFAAIVKAKPAETPDKPLAAVNEPDEKPVVETATVEKATVEKATFETPSEPVAARVQIASVVVEPEVTEAEETAVTTTQMAFAATSSDALAPTAEAPRLPKLLDVVGTVIFNLYAAATRLVGGPAQVPPGSTVTGRSSELRIDCGCEAGDGFEVPADWYIPEVKEGETAPTRLIYLQHGFLASGPWYSYTAATLAEQTNSIVVAPSITSNFLASDACWLGAPAMQQAVANLFEDENTALADSLGATGYQGALPQEVVLVGHSLGGGLVAGTASYMVENETVGKLRGVVMLDGVGLDDSMADSLENVPDGIPVYQLAAPKYFWNQFGVGTDALLEARPGEFIGVTLVGGSHVDSMRGGSQLIQISQQIVAGFSKPQNVAAAQILMVGWVNDMFNENQEEGIYLEPGEEFVLDTPEGQATLVDLPNSLTKRFLFNPLQVFVPLASGLFTFEPVCVAESMAKGGSCTSTMAA